MLLPRIERYLKARRIPPTRFGRDAVGDPCFVFDLRDGREPRGSTAARVAAYLDRAEAEHISATAVSDGADR
jgi:hypothetical protein